MPYKMTIFLNKKDDSLIVIPKKKILFTALIVIQITMNTNFKSNGQTIEQSLISTSGETFKTQNFQFDWSIGEVSTSTFTNSQIKLTEGFHQKDIKITEVNVPSINQFKFEVYPNPATNYIVIKADAINIPKVRSIISDTNGKVIMKPTISSTNQEIDVSQLTNGIYYLRILYDNNTIKTYKIVKSTNN